MKLHTVTTTNDSCNDQHSHFYWIYPTSTRPLPRQTVERQPMCYIIFYIYKIRRFHRRNSFRFVISVTHFVNGMVDWTNTTMIMMMKCTGWDIYDKRRKYTLSMANVKRKLISWAVSSTGRCINPSVCKCFGVDTDSAIVSPMASWKAEMIVIFILFFLLSLRNEKWNFWQNIFIRSLEWGNHRIGKWQQKHEKKKKWFTHYSSCCLKSW